MNKPIRNRIKIQKSCKVLVKKFLFKHECANQTYIRLPYAQKFEITKKKRYVDGREVYHYNFRCCSD